jgi:glucosamine--fructose-6-phosphate aminotransferase (isomerizing)
MGATEQTIFDQFQYWRKAAGRLEPLPESEVTAFIGCGTSYNLAMSLAALSNAAGRPAIAAPGGEWANRAQSYWGNPRAAHVVALSRSGETSETVAAAMASRAAGIFVTGITVEEQSALAVNSDRVVAAATDPREGIVMTTSASLMLQLGAALIGRVISDAAITQSEALLRDADARITPRLANRLHFVYLGGGAQYGVAVEGALKLMEMSQSFTQAFHPLEYRHGPISLVDDKTLAVMLYSGDQHDAEATLAGELQAKGALVIGLGGPGDVPLAPPVDTSLAGLIYLPVLQLMGERVAQANGLDTAAPRHLTKVVTLA